MSNTEQLDILYKLKKEVEKSKNGRLVHIINQVIKKVFLQQYTATFVGHFSAGKSTLINLLLEETILPSSPVPTTSNTAIVSVADQPGIIANLSNKQYTLLNNYDDVKKMNRENFDVESVEIKFPSDKFRKGFTLQDTPGVDSNVSSHQSSTEEFMYTSNVLFYTVDYNHVQSALNFQFMKQLNQAGVPVVFVINQIDKHNEDEISFDTFKSRVEKSIGEWEIDLDKTFYVSKFSHTHNEIEALSKYLVEKDKNRETIEDYVNRIVKFITEEQLSYINYEIQDLLDKLDIFEADFEQAYINFKQHQQVSEEAKLLNNPNELYEFLKQKRKAIIDNAYIMTHDTRETIRIYLESRTKDFTVGGLFNKKKKTQEAQQRRLNQALAQLQEKANQEIRQPLREDMSFLTRFINDSEINEAILNQHYEIPESLITDLYQTQITISNQYVLTFCDDLMKSLKQYIGKTSDPLFKKAINHAEANDIGIEQEDDYNDYEKFMEMRNLRESLQTQNYLHYYIHIDDSLDKLIDRKEITYTPKENKVKAVNHSKSETSAEPNQEDKTQNIKHALEIIQDVPLFEQSKQNIDDTLARLDNKIVKIGVFGTFSAGKSSLINALLGDNYLVSSPNPTTAAMTELTYGHHSQITLKSAAQLLEEINQVFEVENITFDSIEALLNKNTNKLKASLEKNKLAFVNAVEKHYDMYQDMLKEGLIHTIDQNEIKKWSAEDEYATFVNTVHLKLPVDWLKDKIIVDSLGLHSNNQRHTNETEKVLTSADLILYVSYFNHSFTDNDKRFIEHMKAMNQLNENQAFKMIINATDLAETEEDLNAVIEYVGDALTQVNMDSDIFAVSSREALKTNDIGIDRLKKSIEHFVQVESKNILQKQMLGQLNHISEAYEQMIEAFHNDKAEITQRNQKLKSYAKATIFKNNLLQIAEQRTSNEVDDQIYHLNERLKLQLLDEVKSIYNGQMTKNSNFNEEKRQSTKLYLDQIHQRLYLEQSLLVQRIKKYFHEQLHTEIAPLKQKLQQLHVFIEPEFDKNEIELDNPYLKIELTHMIDALPKSLSKKNILQPKTQSTIQEQITQETINLLAPCIANLRKAVNETVVQMQSNAEDKFNQFENDAHSQIKELLSFEVDDAFIQQLQETNENLKPYM
ncbi:dynamin family protein [Staphylococcus xylosus]|uniref:dynamin family protein n=1 Tax=Staphylococcus xylosus TaxID=1288 RepID=UPI002DC058A7|nr:dynamin family protein [Staphylococcus xylosus]MEB6289887.1 dynamin family protein [Staphylococcus xylosus]MEB7813448.1 dynamin family protein [Staphylococcus xylosus]MEB7821467.1 dynamin family protein [Staphylococcus xylosus]MEB8175240.1 dynamin family protein [Staphylococcus xylosus]MEB8187143.1 dynamin family protein [Staphylococcus xylosus]